MCSEHVFTTAVLRTMAAGQSRSGGGGGGGGRLQAKAPKHKSTRSRIRDVQRLLAKVAAAMMPGAAVSVRLTPTHFAGFLRAQPDLPATIRASQERALAALMQQLGDDQQGQRERKIQQKYKMVKFFGTGSQMLPPNMQHVADPRGQPTWLTARG
jgi:hypothetical protein